MIQFKIKIQCTNCKTEKKCWADVTLATFEEHNSYGDKGDQTTEFRFSTLPDGWESTRWGAFYCSEACKRKLGW